MGRGLVFVLVALFVFCMGGIAESYTSNASSVMVVVNSTTKYQNITFPYKTRNLNISNMDSTDYIWVDVKSDGTTADYGKCVIVGPGDTLDLYDFATDGISVLWDNGRFGIGEASPVSVIATY